MTAWRKKSADPKVVFIQVTGQSLSTTEKRKLSVALSEMDLGLTFVFIDERWKVISEEKAISLFEQMAHDIKKARSDETKLDKG